MSKVSRSMAGWRGLLALAAGELLPAAARAASGETPEQKVDQIVKLLNDPDVQALLKSHGAAAPAASAPASAPDPLTAWLDLTRGHLHDVGQAAINAPQTIANVATEFWQRIDGWSFPLSLLFVAVLIGVAYAARIAIARKLPGMRRADGTTPHIADLLLFALMSALATVIAVVVAHLVLPWPQGIEALVRPWVVAGVAMYLVVRLSRTFEAVEAGSPHAAHWCRYIRRFMAVFLFGWAVARTLLELGADRDFVLLVAYLFGVGLIVVASRAVWKRPAPEGGATGRRTAANIGLTFAFVVLGAMWVADMTVAMWVGIYALALPVILPLITRIVRGSLGVSKTADLTAVEAEAGAEAAADAAHGMPAAPRPPTIRAVVIDRGARLVVLVLAMAWLTSVLNAHAERFMQSEMVSRLLAGLFQGVVVLVVADFLWQITRAMLLKREADAAAASADPVINARNGRMRTLLPILRNAIAALIGTIAVLMVLSGLGVAIGPLIAGAGVFGVAIGFGSQTLVKDIISGVFYLLDDAFRVGEYIQTGSYKGTVEGFSLRSVRLRHHRGPVYTVPFGSLGAVQNMSRDWGKDKFLITVPFDTDLEKVRKIAKKIGQAIQEDPELGPAIIEPVKMKGVEQVADHGLVLGFGMMFKPTGQQTMIRRKAYAMLRQAFAENGIEFAQPVVHVAASGGDDEAAAAARAVVIAAERKAAEAAE